MDTAHMNTTYLFLLTAGLLAASIIRYYQSVHEGKTTLKDGLIETAKTIFIALVAWSFIPENMEGKYIIGIILSAVFVADFLIGYMWHSLPAIFNKVIRGYVADAKTITIDDGDLPPTTQKTEDKTQQ